MAQLGFIPEFFSDYDDRPAKEQIAENYGHGGGYHPMEGWEFNPEDHTILYTGEEPYKPLAHSILHEGDETEEHLYFYEYAWVCIVQMDGTFAVTRMDWWST